MKKILTFFLTLFRSPKREPGPVLFRTCDDLPLTVFLDCCKGNLNGLTISGNPKPENPKPENLTDAWETVFHDFGAQFYDYASRQKYLIEEKMNLIRRSLFLTEEEATRMAPGWGLEGSQGYTYTLFYWELRLIDVFLKDHYVPTILPNYIETTLNRIGDRLEKAGMKEVGEVTAARLTCGQYLRTVTALAENSTPDQLNWFDEED